MAPGIIAALIQAGTQLLPLVFGGGDNTGEEDAREDQYNYNSGAHIDNYMRDYIMQPIGPAPGMPTLDDPSAFEGYDPMNPMAYGNPGGTYEAPPMSPADYDYAAMAGQLLPEPGMTADYAPIAGGDMGEGMMPMQPMGGYGLTPDDVIGAGAQTLGLMPEELSQLFPGVY